MIINPPQGYHTVVQAALVRGVSTRTIIRWCDTHGLVYTRVNPVLSYSSRLIRASDLEAFVQPEHRPPMPSLTQREKGCRTRHKNRLTKCQSDVKAKARR